VGDFIWKNEAVELVLFAARIGKVGLEAKVMAGGKLLARGRTHSPFVILFPGGTVEKGRENRAPNHQWAGPRW